jgi:hypothetical protein
MKNIEESGILRVWAMIKIWTLRLKHIHIKTLLKKLMPG